jgi:hypothetical protein
VLEAEPASGREDPSENPAEAFTIDELAARAVENLFRPDYEYIPRGPSSACPDVGLLRLAAAVLESAIHESDENWFLRGNVGLFTFREVSSMLNRHDTKFIDECLAELRRRKKFRALGTVERRRRMISIRRRLRIGIQRA